MTPRIPLAFSYDPLGPSVSLAALALAALALWLYLRGLARPRRLRPEPSLWQQGFFGGGILLILAASNAPLAPLGQSLFSVHQVAHLLLRLVGPLLIAVSQPWGIFHAALPRRWRGRSRALDRARLTRWMRHPAVATALLIGALYIWQIPALFGLARHVAMVEFSAHLGMALAGLWFFAILLDPRDPPEGARRGARLLAGFVVIVSNILLGSLTTLKEVVLYSAHRAATWDGQLSPISDEAIGGYTIWVPSSMVMIAAIILVFNGWNRAEERRWNARHTVMRQSNAAALEFPETAAELRMKVAKPNRDMGRTLAFGTLAMFAIVVVTAITVLSL